MSLFFWGSNSHKQIKGEENLKAAAVPAALEALRDVSVQDFAIGDGFALAASDMGHVYSWGYNKFGQLGLGSLEDAQPKKVDALKLENVTNVSCGAMHSMALTSSGQVYMWGLVHRDLSANQESQQADADAAEGNIRLEGLAEEEPLSGSRLARWSEQQYALAGLEQSQSGNNAGLLRMKIVRRPLTAPCLCESLLRVEVTKIAAGFGHSIVLSTDGMVYGCGYNDRGQLGLGHRFSTASFQQLDLLKEQRIVDVACGQQHTLVCSTIEDILEASGKMRRRGGTVFTFGLGALGQLGHGTTEGSLCPRRVEALDSTVFIRAVAAGMNHSVGLSDEGEVYSWGHAEYNQHGNRADTGGDLVSARMYFIPQCITDINEKLVSISCGSHNTIGIADSGNVYTWGWNDFGVLGRGGGYQRENIGKLELPKTAMIAKAGYSNCGVVLESSPSFRKYFSLFKNARFPTMLISTDDSTEFSLHLDIIRTRSPYLWGYIRALAQDAGIELGLIKEATPAVLQIPDIASQDLESVLCYIYCDELQAKPHRLRFLAELASNWRMERLAQIIESRQSGPEVDVSPSTFEEDMRACLQGHAHHDAQVAVLDDLGRTVLIPALKDILSLSEYFEALFTVGFREAESGEAVDLTSLQEEGVFFETVQVFLEWLYTQSRQKIRGLPMDRLLNMLVLVDRLGEEDLQMICELEVIQRTKEDLNSVDLQSLYHFAEEHHAWRLQRFCQNVLFAS